MAILNETLNKNYLSPLGFRLLLNKLPTTEYFVQSCSLPAVSSTPIVHPNPLTNMVRLPGDRVEFDQFSINFRVDEDMKNYTEMIINTIYLFQFYLIILEQRKRWVVLYLYT